MSLENYFQQFRESTIGHKHNITTPYGEKTLIYADWIASGRLYKPIEDKICNVLGPMVANTHSEASDTGKAFTLFIVFQGKEVVVPEFESFPKLLDI